MKSNSVLPTLTIDLFYNHPSFCQGLESFDYRSSRRDRLDRSRYVGSLLRQSFSTWSYVARQTSRYITLYNSLCSAGALLYRQSFRLGLTPGSRYSPFYLSTAKLLHWSGHFKPWKPSRNSGSAYEQKIWDKYYLRDPTGVFRPIKSKSKGEI